MYRIYFQNMILQFYLSRTKDVLLMTQERCFASEKGHQKGVLLNTPKCVLINTLIYNKGVLFQHMERCVPATRLERRYIPAHL